MYWAVHEKSIPERIWELVWNQPTEGAISGEGIAIMVIW